MLLSVLHYMLCNVCVGEIVTMRLDTEQCALVHCMQLRITGWQLPMQGSVMHCLVALLLCVVEIVVRCCCALFHCCCALSWCLCIAAVQVHLVEVSPYMRQQQWNKLQCTATGSSSSDGRNQQQQQQQHEISSGISGLNGAQVDPVCHPILLPLPQCIHVPTTACCCSSTTRESSQQYIYCMYIHSQTTCIL